MEKCICNIYKSVAKSETYLFVEKKFALTKVPHKLLDLLGKTELVTTMLLDKNKKLANENAQVVLDAICTQGYFLQLPKKEETEMSKIAEKNSKLARS